MASFVPFGPQPEPTRDRGGGVSPGGDGALTDASCDNAAELRGDAFAFTNFNSPSALQNQPGKVSRMTWIMTVVAGVVLGAVMTLIAAGA